MIFLNYGLISLIYFPLVGLAVFEPYKTPLLVVGGIVATMFFSWKLRELRLEVLDLKSDLQDIRSNVLEVKDEWMKEKAKNAN